MNGKQKALGYSVLLSVMLASCNKRSHFSVSSPDGSVRIDGETAKPIAIPGRTYLYVFSDSLPDSVAREMLIEVDGNRLKVPAGLARKIANPNKMNPVSHSVRTGSGRIQIRGGDGAGAMSLTLEYAEGDLLRASADTCGSYTPWEVWP